MSSPARQTSAVPPEVREPSHLGAVTGWGLPEVQPDTALDDLTALLCRLLGAPTAFLALVDQEHAHCLSASGLEVAPGARQPLATSLCEHVVTADAPVVVDDATADPRSQEDAWVSREAVRAWAGFPVRDADGLVVGALCAVDARTRSWEVDDVDVLMVLAAAASTHLALVAATSAERRTRDELATSREAESLAGLRLDRLARVTMELATTDTLPQLIDVLIDRALPVLGVDGGAVLLRDDDRFRLAISDRLGEDVQTVYGSLPLDSPLPACHVARTGRRLVLADRAAGLAFTPEMSQVYDDTGRQSWVFSPLELGGELLGCLAVCWVEERAGVPADELELIDAFAAQCATALVRIRSSDRDREGVRTSERDRLRTEGALRAQARALELMAGGAPVGTVFDALARWVEQSLEDTPCAVLLVDDLPGAVPVLRVAAAPEMPALFTQAVDGSPVDLPSSPCSVAAATGEPVLVEDLLDEARWAPLHPVASALGVRSCWSFPVRSPATGATLGAVVLHSAGRGLPDAATAALVQRASHLVGITVDRHRLVADLDHQARHDALTGLPNRFELIETLEALLAAAAGGEGAAPVVVFLDLDRLKVINDSLGHQIGDVLLVDMARRLREAVDPRDLVARFGGDEFVVLTGRPDVDVDALARRILDVVGEPLVLEGRLISPAASAGVLVAAAGQTATEVLRDADIAMYRAKSSGGAGYALFGSAMRQRAFDRLDMEAQVRHGLSHDQFRVHYQPIVDLRHDDEIVGFEALVRWQHPERGLLAPADFLRLAEETGLVVPLGAWVLRAVVEAARRWSQLVPTEGLTMSVNVTAQQLHIAGLVQLVSESAAAVAPWSLGLELTESTLMDDTPVVASVVTELAASGAELHIDDFGTGFSSLAYLTRLPIGRLKIDSGFIADLQRKPEATTVVAAIIGLADELGLTVVAEGIETPEQRAGLVAMGCRYGQGFLFGRPLPEEQALALLAGQRRQR